MAGQIWLHGDPVAGIDVNPAKLDADNDGVRSEASAQQTGACSSYRGLTAATNNAASIKASAGRVYAIHHGNGANVNTFLKLYDKATAPAPADDASLIRFVAPAIGNVAGHAIQMTFPHGMAFANGIGIAIVRNAADNDNTAVAANDAIFNVIYK